MNFDCSGPPCLPKKAAGKYPSGQAFCVDVDCVTTPIIAVETYDNTGALVASGYELANANGQPNGTPYTGPVKKVPCDPQRVKFVDSCVPLQVTTGPQPVAPVNGQDCAGAPVAVPKALVETRRVVQEPGTVFTVKLCPDPTSGVELATACNALGDKILLQYDTKTVPPTELSRTNTRTGAAEPAGTLVKCDQDDDTIETSEIYACLNGKKIPGIAVLTDASAGLPTVIGELWRDPVTGTYGALPAGAVVGDCVQPPQVRYDNEDQLEPGCADGVPSTRVTKVIYDDLTGEQVGVPSVVYRDSAGAESATQPANWNLGACPEAVLNSVHWAAPVGNPNAAYAGFAFPNYPNLTADFSGTTNVNDLYVHGIEGAPGVLGTDGLPLTNPTTPVLWANAQPAVDAFLAAAGYAAGSVIIGNDGNGQPVIWFDTNVLTQADIAWWLGPNVPDNYTNKLKADLSINTPAPSGTGCKEGKAWYNPVTRALIEVRDLLGNVVPTPAVLNEGACPDVCEVSAPLGLINNWG